MEEPVAEPVELMKLPEPEITLYQYVLTESVILSPHVEYVDPKQKEIDDLKKQLSALATSFQSYIAAVHPPK
jgi:hypothetical protein